MHPTGPKQYLLGAEDRRRPVVAPHTVYRMSQYRRILGVGISPRTENAVWIEVTL